MQNIIAEQKLRTQRALGELIREGQRKGIIATPEIGRPKELSVPNGNTYPQTLNEVGINRKQSSAFQQIASIPQDTFEDFIQEALNNALAELSNAE